MPRTVDVDPETIEIDDTPTHEVVVRDAGALDKTFFERFERDIAAYKNFKILTLSITQGKDWVKFGESFYLQACGAERLARPLGISWGRPETFRKDSPDGSYTWFCQGVVESKVLGAYIFEMGSCSSKDKFLSAMPGFDPIRDEATVMKKSYQNWKSRAIGSLAGMRNPTPEMFTMAKIDPGKISSVSFKSKDERQAAGAQETAAGAEKSKCDPAVLNEFKGYVEQIVELTAGQKTQSEVIADMTKWTDGEGKSHAIERGQLQYLSTAWAQKAITRAKKYLSDLEKE